MENELYESGLFGLLMQNAEKTKNPFARNIDLGIECELINLWRTRELKTRFYNLRIDDILPVKRFVSGRDTLLMLCDNSGRKIGEIDKETISVSVVFSLLEAGKHIGGRITALEDYSCNHLETGKSFRIQVSLMLME